MIISWERILYQREDVCICYQAEVSICMRVLEASDFEASNQEQSIAPAIATDEEL